MRAGGGFFDLDSASLRGFGWSADARGESRSRIRRLRRATPSAALALLRLHALNGETRLHELARTTLEVFAGVAEQFGIYAGTYGMASVWMAHAHTQVVVIGEGPEADELYAEALAPFALNKIVLRVKDAASLQAALPPALAETISAVAGLQEGGAVAMLCSGFACQPPISHRASYGRLRSAITETGTWRRAS